MRHGNLKIGDQRSLFSELDQMFEDVYYATDKNLLCPAFVLREKRLNLAGGIQATSTRGTLGIIESTWAGHGITRSFRTAARVI